MSGTVNNDFEKLVMRVSGLLCYFSEQEVVDQLVDEEEDQEQVWFAIAANRCISRR